MGKSMRGLMTCKKQEARSKKQEARSKRQERGYENVGADALQEARSKRQEARTRDIKRVGVDAYIDPKTV